MKLRFLFFQGLLVLVLGVLSLRLFDLMVLRGEYHRTLSDNQRVRIKKVIAPRGIIFDRQGRPLVKNTPIYKVCQETKCKEIRHEDALELEVQGRDAQLEVDIGRVYPYGEATAHLLGYLGQATEEEVRSGKGELGKWVGRMGIEEQYEDVLAGIDGGELIEVDTRGMTIRKIGKRDPVPGQNLTLSVDIRLQQVAYQMLKGKKGAVIAQDKDGQVLVLVSSPSFDPKGGVKEVLTNPDAPLFNRAIAGMYPPGSTFKIVTSAAGLEEKKITAQTLIEDPGRIVIGQYHFSNWYFDRYGKTEGVINLVRALARSTDTFFYKVGEMVGARRLTEWAKNFGLAKSAGIDLPGEAAGFLLDPDKGDWFLGNTYHLAIGQGFLSLTPLQVNGMTGVIANGGKLCSPKVGIERGECLNVGLKEETIQIIKEGMKAACSPGGTAGIFFDFLPQVACKTGTAEFDDPKGRTHAWFTVFAPVDPSTGGPEIIVTAVVEGGGEGSVVAAPIAKEVLKEYFRKS